MMTVLLHTTAIFLYVYACAFQKADCSTYHIAFLGRNYTQTPHIGTLFYPTLSSEPTITSRDGSCTSLLSPIFAVSGTSFKEVLINAPECTKLVPNGNELKEFGIKIESSEDFVLHVYQIDDVASTGKNEGYLAISDEHLGNEYYVVTYCSLGGLCQFAVAGITEDTYVNVIFPDNFTVSSVCVGGIQLPDSAPSGSPVTFEINEYQVLHFESEFDLTGTYISSNNRVSVFAGARDIPTSIPYTTANLIEQLPPVSKWGYSFVAAPNYFNDAGDIIKIVTQSDDTVIDISGFSPFKILKKGGSIERRIDWQMHSHIEASNPVLIVQVMSIDIYNESSDVTGTPSMVLVPHVEQWTTSDAPFYCSSTVANQTLISVVADTIDRYSVPILPSPTLFYSSWTAIDGTDYSVQMFKPVSAETTVYGPPRSNYGYCDGSAALLINTNWTWESEACEPTVVSPGDNVDNDCDGQVDEDICQIKDLTTSFTSTQNSVSEVVYKSMPVQGTNYVNLTVKTCDVGMVTLQTNVEPVYSVNIQISPSSLVIEVCDVECLEATVMPIVVSNCDIPQPYTIKWSGSSITCITDSSTYTVYRSNGQDIYYDFITMSAFAGSAEFGIYMGEKDCKKIPRAFPDTLGSEFILPVHNSDFGFFAILSTHRSLSGMVTVQLDASHSLGTVTLNGNESVSFTEADITEAKYDKITVTALGGEISVFLIRSAVAGDESEGPILPTDILGTSYYLYNSTSSGGSNLAAMCDLYAVDHETQTNAGTVPLGINLEINQADYDALGTSHRVKSNRPLAVYCGTLTDTQLQIPSVETLGKVFYIPAIALDFLTANASVVVIATEDSTVVTIRGDYDQMDTIDLKGEIITRTVVSDTISSIVATKPVLVHLQIRSNTITLAADIFIPAVAQYKKDHVFPGFIDNFVEIDSSFAVDNTGYKVASLVNAGESSVNAATHVYNDSTFSLTVLKYIGASSNFFIVPSDVFYNDINEVCTLTTGTPGDGIDNDCDGLIDEEQCSNSTEPGTIDYDIDGSLHEDCAVNTSTTPSVLQLSVPTTMITCPPTTGSGSNNDTGGIVISGTNSVDTSDSLSSLTTPEIATSGTGSPFEPFTVIGATIIFPSTTPAPGSTPAPVETCHTECLCPCGWVVILQNYTEEELAASVIEIQEKLRIKKEELSAVIRQKTSATDDRPSATAVGVVGLVFLVAVLGTVALLDIATLIGDIQTLGGTIKMFFKS